MRERLNGQSQPDRVLLIEGSESASIARVSPKAFQSYQEALTPKFSMTGKQGGVPSCQPLKRDEVQSGDKKLPATI